MDPYFNDAYGLSVSIEVILNVGSSNGKINTV